jgi:hypothetical protein
LTAALGVVCTVVAVGVLSPRIDARRESAPPNRVELCGVGFSCRDIGCHFTFADESPTLTWDLLQEFPDAPFPAFYVPGQAYSMRLDVADPDGYYFGFELATVVGCPFPTNGGTITPADPDRATVVTGPMGIDYLTHLCTSAPGSDEAQFCGFVPFMLGSGLNDWSFTWTAPPRGTGTVQWYFSINSANGDGFRYFDHINTAEVWLEEEPCSPPSDQVIDDLMVSKSTCSPGAPSELRALLEWTDPGTPTTFIRSTGDELALPLWRGEWDLLSEPCDTFDGRFIVYYSVAGSCDFGGEGPH